MSRIVIMPILVPLATAIVSLLAWRWRSVQRIAGVCGTALLLAAALALLLRVDAEGLQVMQIGGWPAPYGISIVADLLSAVMVVMAGLMGFAVSVYSLATTDIEHESFGYHPLYQILLLGVCGSFLTGDIFNLYVWFEVMLIASFVLIALGGHGVQMEGALKYVTLNLIASAFFLAAVGVLYGTVGTLNLADLARVLRSTPPTGMITVLSMLFLVAFGIKAAVFPLFFWLPASYHTPPVAVSAIFAGLLTKVGVYALIRVFTLLFDHDPGFTHELILIIAAFTMVTGVLGAVAQSEFRRLLSFHIVSQIGYLLMGLGIGTQRSLAAAVFFLVHVMTAKAALFLVSGVVHALSGTYDLKRLGGLYRKTPFLAFLFLVFALSLAGIPPLPGFWAKLGLIRAGLEAGRAVVTATALIVSILTLYSMTKIWTEAFWKDRRRHGAEHEEALAAPQAALLYGPMILLALITVALGLMAEPLLALSLRAAEQLLTPGVYIRAVLGGAP